MKHISILILLIISVTNVYSQNESIWLKITPRKSTRDLGFDKFAKAAISTSNRVQSNHVEIQNIINQSYELFEEKIANGCGLDFGEYFYDKLNNAVENLNNQRIDYSAITVNNIKTTFNSIQREMIYYDCNKVGSVPNTTPAINSSGSYSDKSLGFPKTAMISKQTTLWDSCDWMVMKSLGKINSGNYITVHSICQTNIQKNLCFITLSNGKSAFVYSTDIEF